MSTLETPSICVSRVKRAKVIVRYQLMSRPIKLSFCRITTNRSRARGLLMLWGSSMNGRNSHP